MAMLSGCLISKNLRRQCHRTENKVKQQNIIHNFMMQFDAQYISMKGLVGCDKATNMDAGLQA